MTDVRLVWLATFAQIVDLATFPIAVSIWGVSGESNFLMGWVYLIGGVAAIAVVKLIGVGASLWMSGLLSSWRRKLALIVIAGMGVLGALTNITAILVS